jgi:transposase
LLKRQQLVRPAEAGKGWTRGFIAWLQSLAQGQALRLGVAATLATLLRQLNFLEEEVARIERDELTRLAAEPRYAAALQRLVQLQGVGTLTGLVFLTELGDLARFANRRQLSAYLGLVPTTYDSGDTKDHHGRITRQGPARVRRVLCQASWARLRCDTSDAAAYQRIAAKNPKHKKIAVVASMRRLAIRMWHQARPKPPERNGCELVRQPPSCAPAG